jgi:hypothetical protein
MNLTTQDLPTTIAPNEFAHEISLTNLGNLRYETSFGELKLEALWGPAVSLGFVDVQTIGVATANGALCLLHTSYEPTESLLEVTGQILVSACADSESTRDKQ